MRHGILLEKFHPFLESLCEPLMDGNDPKRRFPFTVAQNSRPRPDASDAAGTKPEPESNEKAAETN